jgi:uncharacterized protein (DUF488 family)
MIYTIGYQGLPLHEFQRIIKEKHISILVDVRSKPYGRAFQYNRSALEPLMKSIGVLYWYKGDVLGGFAEIKPDALRWLEGCADKNACEFGSGFKVPAVEFNHLILCFEANPSECHRHYALTRHLLSKGFEVIHLLKGGGEIKASDLEAKR